MVQMKDICEQVPVIPVLVVDQIDKAETLAKILVEAGLHVLEVTLRTSTALEVIEVMSKVPGAVVGAGTVLTPEDLSMAKRAGAQFAVSPGYTENLLTAAQNESFPILPGASTAAEVMELLEIGFDMLKFFPAESAGGISMLKSLHGPFPGVAFCPTGGISEKKASDYLSLPNVLCIGGSWIAPSSLVSNADWSEVERRAKLASIIN